MGWNYISILKLQRCSRWSFEMNKLFHPTIYRTCNYIYMPWLRLIHVNKRGPGLRHPLELCLTDILFQNLNSRKSWWRHQMETFSALLAICAGNSPVPGKFPTQRPVTRSFDVYFDLSPNKRLSKQSLGWWFETLSPPLWRHRNVLWNLSAVGLPLPRFGNNDITHWGQNKWSSLETVCDNFLA